MSDKQTKPDLYLAGVWLTHEEATHALIDTYPTAPTEEENMSDTQTRFAFVNNARSRDEVAAYLPSGYAVLGEGMSYGRTFYVIGGRDDAGWTLDEYVIPRLASGMLFANEVTEEEARAIVASSSRPDAYIGLPTTVRLAVNPDALDPHSEDDAKVWVLADAVDLDEGIVDIDGREVSADPTPEQRIAGAAAVIEREGNDFTFGKPDERDFIRMVLRGAGLPTIDNGDPWIEWVANEMFEDCGETIQSPEDMARFVLDRHNTVYGLVPGMRVRLTRDVERYPHFIAPKGAEGVVMDLGDTQPWTIAVRLDERLEGAEDWDNEVHWYPTETSGYDDPMSDLEVI